LDGTKGCEAQGISLEYGAKSYIITYMADIGIYILVSLHQGIYRDIEKALR